VNLDPRRNQPLVQWILSLPLEFHGDSAFASKYAYDFSLSRIVKPPFLVSKSLAIFGILVDALGIRINSLSDKYTNLLFDSANTGYAEVRIGLEVA
jgi:proteasome activator subunit 4